MTSLRGLDSNVGSRIKDAEDLLRVGRAAEALDICTSIIEQHPDSFRAYEVRSSIHRSAGDLDGALADISNVVRLRPDNAAPLFRRGRYQMMKGRNAEAVSDFSKAITLDSGYFGESLHFYRAEAYLRMGRFSDALEDCRAVSANYFEQGFFGHSRRTKADIEAEAKLRLRGNR